MPGGDGGVFSKWNLIKEYKFVLAIENSNVRDYVTEKWFQCLDAGTVPLYYGLRGAVMSCWADAVSSSLFSGTRHRRTQHCRLCAEPQGVHQHWRLHAVSSVMTRVLSTTIAA